MPDPITIASGISAVKTTFDALRTAIGLVKDTKELLSKEKAEVVDAALATAESSSLIAEADGQSARLRALQMQLPAHHYVDRRSARGHRKVRYRAGV
jgi:hypothetical protein